MKEPIKKIVKESQSVKDSILAETNLQHIEDAANHIIDCIKKGGKVIVFGNGGSAADSQHMAAELVGRFKKERKPIPAISLTTNTSSLTALSNDYGYAVSFKRQIEALGKNGDVAIGLSTSGESQNVIKAMEAACKLGIKTIALTGQKGGPLKNAVDTAISVGSDNTPRIQEAHILIIHIICELVEEAVASVAYEKKDKEYSRD